MAKDKKKEVATKRKTRGSSKNLWDNRQRNLADMPNAKGLVHLTKEQVRPGALYGHTGYFLKELNYFYNVNDSKEMLPQDCHDGFDKSPWINEVRILTARKHPLNNNDSDVGEGLCYLLSFYIAKLINKAFKKGGKAAVDELNIILIKCTREQLFALYEAI